MRPRRFRRGKPSPPGSGGDRGPGFNEAPAIPPGKTRRCIASSGRAPRGFNEAPAIPPGKTRWVQDPAGLKVIELQ